MVLKDDMQRACCSMNQRAVGLSDGEDDLTGSHVLLQIGNLGLQVLWHFLHMLVSLWYAGVGFANAVESSLISSGLSKRFEALDLGKLRYLAIVIESEDAASDTAKVVRLVQWLEAIGVRHMCLYDMEGVLKKSKEFVMANLNKAIPYERATEKELLLLEPKRMTLEIVSASDGKEAVTKAANIMLGEYSEMNSTDRKQDNQIFTEINLTKALRAVGCGGPEPDLLLVYGPARCHLGVPAWRIRYTEIVHMGSLKFARYGTLVKAVYNFTMVRQNYGK